MRQGQYDDSQMSDESFPVGVSGYDTVFLSNIFFMVASLSTALRELCLSLSGTRVNLKRKDVAGSGPMLLSTKERHVVYMT